MTRTIRIALAWALASTVCLSPMAAENADSPSPDAAPVTLADPSIPLDELELMVKPLTADELKVEAKAWMELLRLKTIQTSQAELAIKHKNKSIDKAEEVQEAIEDTQSVLEDVESATLEARTTGSLDAAEDARSIAEEARQSVEETVATIDSAIETRRDVATNGDVAEALSVAEQTTVDILSKNADTALEASELATTTADKAVIAAESGDTLGAARLSGESAEATMEATQALHSSSKIIDQAITAQEPTDRAPEEVDLEQTAAIAGEIAEQELEHKKEILLSVNELRTQRTALSDRLNVVLDELSAKLGTSAEGIENEFIVPFRLYIASVNAIKVDVTDTQSFLSNLDGWLRSDVGGIRLAKQLGYFLLSVLSFWALGWVLGKLVDRALKITRITAELMRSVIVRSVRRITLMVGVIVGLAAMDINVGPILAVVGAAGFVIAFALQDTLSNFASGIMIMIYRPFDVGDLITVGGVTGRARSMNLVSTTIATEDNQLLVIPNNTVWRNIITNTTGSDTRRVDLTFRVGYDDDIEVAQSLLAAALQSHPLVLKDPEPTIAVQNLGAVSVDLICRPWARTDDYWNVYREVTRDVKERFQAAGLKPPYLQANLQIPAPLPDGAAVGQVRPVV